MPRKHYSKEFKEQACRLVIDGSHQASDAARKLGIRMWILLRDQINYEEFCRRAPAATVR